MPRRRNPVRTLFKLEQLCPTSVIVIKKDSLMDDPKNRKILANKLIQKGMEYTKMIILTLPSLDDFSIIDEAQMNKLGWMRIPEPAKEPPDAPTPTV